MSSDGSRPAGDVLSDERSGASIITFRRDTLLPSEESEKRSERKGENDHESSSSGAGRGAEGDSFNWRPTDWAGVMRRKRKNSGTVRVDLASPEDVTLDADGACVAFSSYGTTV